MSHAQAVLFEAPRQLRLAELELAPLGVADVRVRVHYSGISTGTERLFYTGEMPPFPGMGYPLVPGYESVGEVIEAGPQAGIQEGQWVFVPGANCFGPVRGLFGGSASELVTAAQRVLPISSSLSERGVLLALAATAHHAVVHPGSGLPDLIVGHGVMGRLVARLVVALGGQPMVWETDEARRDESGGYLVRTPSFSKGQLFDRILDASGAGQALNDWIHHLRPGGEVVLAGFYSQPLSFDFAPAFLREARLRVAAQWQPADLQAVGQLVADGRLSLDGLITNRWQASECEQAYQQAFQSKSSLKVIMDWRSLQ
jgi:3-hydroxyethyl bacteriochlorophyllide a dehydrogenase